MHQRVARRIRSAILLVCIGVTAPCVPISIVAGSDILPLEPEFSGTLIKRVNGKRFPAQVYAKGARIRLEYRYAIRTELGFASIEIVRLDLAEIWYVLPQQRQLLVLPITDDTLSIRPELIGETCRTTVGDAMAAGRAARLFDVQTDRHGQLERFYQWVDAETGIMLKLVSQDRDWSLEYERIRMSPQPSMYFEEPRGYRKRRSETNLRRGQ